jgi:hypothetical protein
VTCCSRIEFFLRIIRKPTKERLTTKPNTPLIAQTRELSAGFRNAIDLKIEGKNFSRRGWKTKNPQLNTEKV